MLNADYKIIILAYRKIISILIAQAVLKLILIHTKDQKRIDAGNSKVFLGAKLKIDVSD